MAVADGGRAAARGDRLVKLILAWGSARSQCSDTPVTEHQPEQTLHWHPDSSTYRLYNCLYDYCYHMESDDAAAQQKAGVPWLPPGRLRPLCASAAGRPRPAGPWRFVTDTQDHFGPL